MIVYKCVWKLLQRPKHFRSKRNPVMQLNVVLYHCSEDYDHEETPPSDSYEKAFLKLKTLEQSVKNVDLVGGRLINMNDHTVLADDQVWQNVLAFKSLARIFIGSPQMQQALAKKSEAIPLHCFSKPSEREPITVNSLTKVCNFLNISAQQRKVVRLTICPQVTQHQIWTGALGEILNELKSKIDLLRYQSPTKGIRMGQQILLACLKFLNAATSYDLESASWMRLAPAKVGASSVSHKWEEVLEMFSDLVSCLKTEKELVSHVTKLEGMKEGLFQIKDVLIDKNIGYKETRHQESLVQKKLTKTLGHSSRCLFILLLYYLYGSVRDIDVELCGGIYEAKRKGNFYLCMGKILTSDEENMLRNGAMQLNKALGLFEFVWKTAGMKGSLERQGHLWCVGAEDKLITYKGNKFFVHGISL